jgi:uncharacterized protein
MKILLLALTLITTQAFAQSKATQKLFSAVEENNLSKAKKAIKHGADVNGAKYDDAPSSNPLHKAVQFEQLEMVKLLLDNGAEIDARRPVDMHTPLMIAATRNYSQIAQLLIQRGAELNLASTFNRSALLIAAFNNSLETAEALMKTENIDVNIRPNNCALAVAAKMGNLEIVKLLVNQEGSKVSNTECVAKAIELAQFNHHDQIVEILTK